MQAWRQEAEQGARGGAGAGAGAWPREREARVQGERKVSARRLGPGRTGRLHLGPPLKCQVPWGQSLPLWE